MRPNLIIVVVIAIFLVIGFFVVNQYGESIDEPPRMAYAEISSQAYSGGSVNLQDEKGPFYGMLALLSAKILVHLVPGWKLIDGWNYMSFVAFVMGVFFFYRLCRRIFDQAPSIAASLLFSTQPILWGHAFINPKDIPFMAFFLASFCLGLEMVDYWEAQTQSSGQPLTFGNEITTLRHRLPEEWSSSSKRLHRFFVVLAVLLAALLISYPMVRWLVSWVVKQVYASPLSSGLGQIFNRFAENSSNVQAEAYIGKALTLYGWLALMIGIGLVVGLISTLKRIFPSLIGWSMQSRLLLAGCLLGFASDIRTLGPASGLLVGIFFLYKGGRKVIPYVLEYLAIGAIVVYIFWPNLWKNPLGGYLASFTQASDFPFNGSILFAGHSYNSDNLPRNFLPTLFGLQLTETALVLIIMGLITACIYVILKPALRVQLLLVGAWFIGPIAAAILLDSTIYNNFRQLLFVVPAIFFFAGLALQVIWTWLKGKPLFFIPLMMIILLPGLYWNWQLHPYQYTYYNSLAGGEASASQNYDMDYWFTTYKEGAEFVNRVAPENSVVYFWNNYTTALPYIRTDLKLTEDEKLEGLSNTQSFYAVIATHYPATSYIFNRSEVVYRIIRGGAVLAVVKLVNVADYLQDN